MVQPDHDTTKRYPGNLTPMLEQKDHHPEPSINYYQSSEHPEQSSSLFLPVAPYDDGYETPYLQLFWKSLDEHYVEEPANNVLKGHILDYNRREKRYVRLSTL